MGGGWGEKAGRPVTVQGAETGRNKRGQTPAVTEEEVRNKPECRHIDPRLPAMESPRRRPT